ncbi:hypothetical protein FAES_3936 [Fibrella aestuarina BUZ 2]|uniref:Uncharacterized protein n=1 Tax=Fibrella aestuarina BUZ 2 TaxID=1166018 RepID=I0KCT9_9BACT|nr:hypothetical protein [Fibrella aestuarina]CCH01942.1 hypothetical protein FAES_3936 [Fibrella aestuarina BUZ 2]
MSISLSVFILLLVIADVVAIVATVFIAIDPESRENRTRFWLLIILASNELGNLIFILLTYHHYVTQHALTT